MALDGRLAPPAAETAEPQAIRSRLRRRRPGRLVSLVAIYLALLAVSHVVRRLAPLPAPDPPVVALRAVDGDRTLERPVRLAYRDEGPSVAGASSTVVLLHGSPGSRGDFADVVPVLAQRHRVVVPDLPGFGASTLDVPEYSIRAHARYVLQLIDALDVREAHVVGFSMGGGVGLELYALDPGRVASLTLLSSIGVQELELFGDYRMNHTLHGLQLGALWLLREGLPHMGWLDGAFLGVPYARNFYDTDQRPSRGILRRFEPPMLVLHGSEDFLVPPAAALEHHRLVPQSELDMRPASHFMVFEDGRATGQRIAAFLERVERGEAPRREAASGERLAAAARPFDPAAVPPYTGLALLIMMALVVASTFITEDLACIAAGLLVARGRMDLAPALVACFVGILVGDVLLFLAGRFVGRPALRRAPLRWLIREEQVALASRWLERRGALVILASRFLPGARLPAYFTAGLLHTNLAVFSLYFAAAVAVWTPLLVLVSAAVGERAFAYFESFRANAWLVAALLALWILFLAHVAVPALTFRGRRRLRGRFERIVNWEFWPPWVFYPPVVAWAAWLGVKHRGPLVFTAANPAIEAGGFIAESKQAILDGLRGAAEWVARSERIPATASPAQRSDTARAFLARHGLGYPVVLKPDAGQRGSGVAIARSEQQMLAYLERVDYDTLIQEYVPGQEFGVFYYRRPDEPRGRILSITEKRMPFVTGDGTRTIEELILADRRAVALVEIYLTAQAEQLFRVPVAGERVQLVELGTHCRGALFFDGRRLLSDDLERVIDRISRSFDGFYFGRYDVRAASAEDVERGRDFKIIELNGVTSEATHIYDPAIGPFRAWATLFEQWSIAFEIGRANRERGSRSATAGDLLRLIRRYRRSSRGHA